MGKGLTTRAVEAAKAADERQEIADAYLRNLYLVVQAKTGAKSWAVRYRFHGQSRKLTLGSFPAIDLKAARELGAKALRAVAEGHDPAREKVLARITEPDTIEAVAAQFIERHCQRVNRPKTIYETERLLNRHVLPRWRGRPIASIARRDVLNVLDRVIDSGAPIEANRTLAAVRKLFNWALSRDIIAASPCAGVKPPAAEQSRDRVLSDDELRNVWGASAAVGWPLGPIVQMLILTGQRRDEVGRMAWSELDLKAHLWTLPRERVKTNQAHEVPLSDAAVTVLKALPRIAASSFVFTTDGVTVFSGFSKSKCRLDALLPKDMAPWRLHDIRRSAASGLARLGVNLPVIEKILNHSSGSFAGIVGVYQKHSFADEKRKALDVWGDFVSDLVSDKPAPKKVIKLRNARRG
jgi:integrase